MDLTDNGKKTWLITGADKGLGAAVAETALRQGDNVAVTVLAKDGSHPLAAEFPESFMAIHLDARDHDRFAEVVAKVVDRFGRIDVLHNNAGYGLIGLAEETVADVYRPLFEVNFFAVVEMIRHVLPVMRSQRYGHILNVSSIAGFGAAPGWSFYSATKFAVEGYSEALAAEVHDLGIKVTIIEPGGFRSDFAGPSLATQADGRFADYAALTEGINSYSAARHKTQPNSPEKFGLAVCTLAALPTPPLRLPFGIEAVAYLRSEMASVEAELAQWTDLAYSTAIDPDRVEVLGVGPVPPTR
jgi:NAD(P)-dependent dehydrogenase (short-subunit alcohol dehydrogenase family)